MIGCLNSTAGGCLRRFKPGADIEHPHGLHGESLVVAHGVQVVEVLLADVARDVLTAETNKST